MGVSKLGSFSENQNRLAVLAKAMGHPARIAILEVLIKHKTCLCADIVSALPLAQATISQHLKELKDAGIIHAVEEHPKVFYHIDEAACSQVVALLGSLFKRMYQSSVRA